MGLTFSRLIGIAAILLALARLGRLLEPTVSGPPWPVVLIAATLLGAGVTALTRGARASAPLAVAAHLLVLGLLVARVLAPEQLLAGVLPGPSAWAEARLQLGIAGELIRFGAAPVIPVPGLTAVLAVGFWAFGYFVAGSRPLLHSVPPLIGYLQFATLDRRPPGSMWILGFVVIATLALTSMAVVSTESIGRLYTRGGRVLPRRSGALLGTALVLAGTLGMGAASALAPYIPESGLMDWRTQSGVGSGLYGSGSFNAFVGLQQSLVRLSDEPMFFARVSRTAPENSQLYWRLLTLDVFDGEFWRPSDQTFAKGGEPRWERTDWAYRGDTTRVAANVLIAGLSDQWLPTIYSPVELSSDDELLEESFRVREDGSIAVDLRVLDGWTYQIDADVPVRDLASLATSDGQLSPIFQEAVDAGVLDLSPAAESGRNTTRPESLAAYTSLPNNTGREVRDLAREVTAGASTAFERGVLLESFFRDSREFTYSTEVDTGHTSLDLEEWLLDDQSRNFRTGYCEQFATAMGVMSRALNIPTRVVLGFTPGTVEKQSDGTDVIVVRERNAHAWVELWMDGQGWVRFDPTPRSDGVNPSLSAQEVPFDARQFIPAPGDSEGSATPDGAAGVPDRLDEGEEPLPSDGSGTQGGAGNAWLAILVGAIVLAAIAALVPMFKMMRRRRRIIKISDGQVAVAWREIVDRLSDLGAEPDPTYTPMEIARRESPDLVPLARLYSAAAYGGRTGADCLGEFNRAEAALRRRYEGRRWRTSYMRLDSLRP